MSRLIVKNISKALDAKELTKAFSKVGTVTDCKIAIKDGKHRRFCFIGFKNPEEAVKAQAYFNNTFIGTSKVQVDFAKSRDQIQQQAAKKQQKLEKEERKSDPKPQNEPVVKKKFQSYKEVIQKSSQQSWNDLLVGQDVIAEQKPKKMKKQIKKEKIEAKTVEKAKAVQKKVNKIIQANPINIKPPKLSLKNEKYIQGPLKVDETRLYVTNFPNTAQEDEIVSVFQKYGNVVKSKLPKDENGKLKGFGFFTFEKPEQALRAFNELDNKIIFGRYLHIKPALEDIGGIIKNKKEEQYQQKIKQKFGDVTEDKSSYKKKKKAELRRRLEDTTSWNTLFLNPNTLLEHMAKRHGVTKSQILMSENLPVKMALVQTEVIDETKQWMKSEGLNLDFLQTDRNLCERSKTTILVKNLNYNSQPNDLKELFSYYGVVDRLLLCPNRTIALVEFQSEEFAQNAFDNLSYHKFKGNPLYLQWAPVNILTKEKIVKAMQKAIEEEQNKEELGKVLYVKNLNFLTSQDTLKKHLQSSGEIKSVKIIKDKQGNPMGYGFVQFSKQQAVLKAIKTFQNSLLEGHTLQLSVSKKNTQQLQNRRKKQQLDFQPTSAKLVVRNVAFQATKQELKQLFKQFGTIKGIRLPKKMDGQHRGFAFVEYETLDEAKQAFISLSNSHLYGRKLVIEWQESSKNN